MLGLNTFDLMIIVLALIAVARGLQLGFFRQFFSLAGFFIGLFLGSAIAPFIARALGTDRLMQTIVALILVIGTAILAASIGETLGRRVQRKIISGKHLATAESMFGIFLSVVSTVILAWLMASILLRLPTANIAAGISESRIMQILDRKLPPAPSVMARIGHLISPLGFPRVFTGIEPFSPDAGTPNEPEVIAAAERAAVSTVRIESLGCGGIVFGSGFVIEQGLIATNAHVIAGIRNPIVADQEGRYRATTVWFDPGLDFALLRVNSHAGPPLELATENISRGTTTAVLGFPGGGAFTVDSAVVLSRQVAVGRNIYDTSLSRRDIYELHTQIEQGNSGGPVALSDGRVIGMVFGKSAAREDRGYAITASQIEEALRQARNEPEPTSTGRCVRG